MEEQQAAQDNQPTGAEQAATTNGGAASDDVQLRIKQLEQEAASMREQYLRAAADLKNFKRRTEEERGNLIRNATAGLIMKVLPVVDDLDLAMQHVPAEVAGTSWFNGIQGVQRKLLTVLESEGVKPIDAQGQTFDPNFHDAVMHEDAGAEHAGKVTADLRKGYTLHDRVIRPSMVKVGQE